MTADVELLPLPEPAMLHVNEPREWFTAKQMQSYARACIAHATAAKDAELRNAWRALWLVLRQTGTVAVTRHEIVSADWSRCQVEQTEHEATGTVRLRALLREQEEGHE